jgi:hypothetical protein
MPWKRGLGDTPTGPVQLPYGDELPSHGLPQSFADSGVETMALQAREHDQRLGYPSLRLMRLLLVFITLAAIAASVAVVLQMRDRSAASTPTADAHTGDCLTWPPGVPERAVITDCADDHVFEVADSQAVETNSVPATSSSDVEFRQKFQQMCAQAVGRYLGPRYDPGGRFVVGAVFKPLGPDRQFSGRLLCGLQLPSDGAASAQFRGRVVDQDQSSIWPAGTCLGIKDGQPTEVVVGCASPHAVEITGMDDLSTAFDQAAPSIEAQDAVVRDACTAVTSSYLSPDTLAVTGLVLRYRPIEATGWIAGGRRIACRIGSPKADGGWATLVGTAKTGLLIDGQPAAPAPNPVGPAAAPVIDSVQAEPPDTTTAPAAAEPAEPPQATPSTEAPVTAAPDTHGATIASRPQPHLVGAEAPGPGPSSGSPSVQSPQEPAPPSQAIAEQGG